MHHAIRGGTATELREAARRILWHWKLLLLCAGLGLLVPFAAFEGPETLYSASVQLLVHPGDLGETSPAAQTVAAVASEQAQRRGDLHPEKWVHDVQVQTVGESGVVQISVIDEDPVVASDVANSLAGQVVAKLAVVAPAQRDIESLQIQIKATDDRLAALDELDPDRGTLEQHKADLEAQLTQKQAELVAGLPSVLGTGATPETARRIPSSRAQDLAFGALLGLVVGIAAAALAEALNPTLVGRESISAEAQAPVLGLLPDLSGTPSEELSWLGWQLAVQAKRTKVATLELTSAGPDVDLDPLSAALTTAIATQRVAPSRRVRRAKAAVGGTAGIPSDPASSSATPVATAPPTSTIQVRVLDRANLTPVTQNGSTGLVVVTPTVVKRVEMDAPMDLLQVTGWPLVGAITYRKRRIVRALWRLVHRSNRSPMPSREVIDVP